MKKILIGLLITITTVGITTINSITFADAPCDSEAMQKTAAAAQVQTPVKNNKVESKNTKTAVKPAVKETTVSPVAVVNNPDAYLNKTITFNAEFVAYSSLGLDYKPAFRDGSKYISILIKRDDVSNHTIPLSEMKIFVTREEAEKHVDLEQGDKIKITGTVFSTALGDPWVDVKTFTVLSQKNKTTDTK